MDNIQTDYSKQVSYSYQTSNTNPNNNEETQKELKDKIKTLQQKLKAYQIMTVEQNKKITEHDNLVVEYNSLNKNYTELESEFECLKLQNSQLMDAINSKNCLIDEYQKMLEVSKEKFEMLDKHNLQLKALNNERENKLKTLPNMLKNNEQLNDQINDYENK